MSNPDGIRITRVKRNYTLIEATDLIMQMDRDIPGSGSALMWVNSKTGRPMTIGYTT